MVFGYLKTFSTKKGKQTFPPFGQVIFLYRYSNSTLYHFLWPILIDCWTPHHITVLIYFFFLFEIVCLFQLVDRWTGGENCSSWKLLFLDDYSDHYLSVAWSWVSCGFWYFNINARKRIVADWCSNRSLIELM